MELGLNEEQELLKASAEKYFRDNYSFELRRNYIETASNNNKQWKHFSDLGWLGLPLDTKYGGYSGNISDVMVLMETFGSSLVLEPYVNFIILSGKIIEKFSPSDKAALILPLIIRGERKISFAFSEPYSRYDNKEVQTIAIKDKQSWILKGMKNFVIGSSFCDQFLIPAICKEEKEIKIFLLNKKTENLVINSLQKNNRNDFLSIEMSSREALKMPPFGKLASIILSSKNEVLLKKVSLEILGFYKSFNDIELYGPAPAQIYLIRGRYRMRFLLKTSKKVNIQKVIKNWLSEINIPSSINMNIDIDPYSFL